MFPKTIRKRQLLFSMQNETNGMEEAQRMPKGNI